MADNEFDSSISPSSVIRLNIGGKQFCTSLDTLTQREPDSMLAIMFSGRHTVHQDPDTKHVFIDRDGKHFRYILNWLREGVLQAPQDYSTLAQLLTEANYFQLPGLMSELQNRINQARNHRDSSSNTAIIDDFVLNKRHTLHNRDLSGLDASKLSRPLDFGRACVRNVLFSQARLQHVRFKQIDAECVNFCYANLEGCNFVAAHLRHASFIGACLKDVDFEGACLIDCNFSKADMGGAKLKGANLEGSKFIDANLKSADFRGALVTHCNLSKANLESAKFGGAKFQCVKLTNSKFANLADAYFLDRNLRRETLEKANNSGAVLTRLIPSCFRNKQW